MPRELVVDPVEAGGRIDVFLVGRLSNKSRSAIQKLITSGSITLNGKTTTQHRVLRSGDRITIRERVAVQTPSAGVSKIPTPTILFENDAVLVIDKPSGLTVHPGIGTHDPTLVDWLRLYVPTITTVGDDRKVRPGIVHRLDRDVSGVMVVAKTQASFENLKRQFKDRTIEKEYLALVHGIPRSASGTIKFRIDRSKRMHGKMAAYPETGEGRDAVTHWAIERKVKNNALLRVTIETGRTHQIRVHLKSIGHPIVGDAVYTIKQFRHKTESLGRPFLHAARLSFTDLDGTERSFEAPLPEKLRRFQSQ